MFERYTEKARRTIFFARYEASQFGSSCIETEHLLLGLLREDKALARLEEPQPRVPLLCIEIIRGDLFSDMRKRCDDYIAEVWLLDPDLKRAYTVTKTEGLREFQGEILRIANPPLEMDLRRVFD
jgi:Clp amino terminal domain, pathogenicity island component